MTVSLDSEAVQPDIGAIALRIQNADGSAEAELYDVFAKGLKLIICRRLGYGPEAEDTFQDVMLIVLGNIRAGRLQDPRCVAGYVHAVMRIHIAHVIEERSHLRKQQSLSGDIASRLRDGRTNAEEDSLTAERLTIARKVLASLCNRDREILSRFYLDEETEEQICADMSLNGTQFRLLKSRAKAKFTEIGKRSLKFPRLLQRSRRAAA
jgi:RNA polymerase sigma-70 factor (ECF subfamily)